MTPIEILKSYKAGYDHECKVKEPQVVTSKIDGCDDAIYRRCRMTDKERMMRDGYDEHDGKTYEKCIKVVLPKRFYSETEVMTFVKYIRKIAGRTITDNEMNILLHTITKGRQYELICLVERSEELIGWNKWVK